jgi:hypothetical protein
LSVKKNKKKKKPPVYRQELERRPQPKTTLESRSTQTPTWKFESLDLGGPWCPAQRIIKKETALNIISKLRSFESMTWAVIDSKPKSHGPGSSSHFIAISKLNNQAKRRLKQLKKDKIEELYSLRLSGTERIFGFFEGRSFHLLWYDPNHEICPVKR